MPFLAPIVALDIVTFGASAGLVGTSMPQMASVVAEACAMQFAMPGIATGVLSGVSGPGVVSSAGPMVGYEPTSMASMLSTSLTSAGMLGPGTQSLAFAISAAFCKNLPMLLATGVSPLVSTGAGVGRLVGFLQPSLYGLLMTQAGIKGLVGSETPRFMFGLSTGLCTYLSAVVTIPLSSVGAPVPPPPVGPLPIAGAPAILTLI